MSIKEAAGLHLKLRKLASLEGRRSGTAPKPKQFTFEIFFPRPGAGTSYHGAQYRAARGKDGLYNFVGLVLGHGGATVQRVQRASGAKIEVRDSAGNLNGAHPSSHGDPSLHVWVAATSRQRLDKAVGLLLEVLAPTNTSLRPVTVLPGSCVVLEPLVLSDCPEASQTAASRADKMAAHKEAAAASGSRAPPPSPPVNAWASNRLLHQHSRERQAAPTPPHGGSARVAPDRLSRTDSGTSQSSVSTACSSDDAAARAVDPLLGCCGGLESPASVLPPTPTHRQRPPSPAAALSAAAPPVQQAAMATVWAKGLHPQEALLETPSTPSGAAERAHSLAPEPSSSASGASWSPWHQGGSSCGATFYEQLQAAANNAFSCPSPRSATAATAMFAAHAGQPLHLALQLGPHAAAAPFPGVGPISLGLAARQPAPRLPATGPATLLDPSYQHSSSSTGMGLGASAAMFARAGPALPGGSPLADHPTLHGEPSMQSAPSAVDHDMQQLLAAIASMATQDC